MTPFLSHLLKNLSYPEKREALRLLESCLDTDRDAARNEAKALYEKAVQAVELAMDIKYDTTTRRKPQPTARFIVYCVLYEKGLAERDVDTLVGMSATSTHYAREVVAKWKSLPDQYAQELEAYNKVKEVMR